MNSTAKDPMFWVDLDKAIEMVRAYYECSKLDTEIDYDKRCDRKCEECDLMYQKGNMGETKNLFENLIEWLTELKTLKEDATNEN